MQNTLDYNVLIEKLAEEDGGGYIAKVPALPGCIADGDTPEEVLPKIQDAIEDYIALKIKLSQPVPEPEYYKIEVVPSGKMSLRLPRILHAQLANQAEKEGCSINTLAITYLAMGIGNSFSKVSRPVSITNNYDVDITPKIEISWPKPDEQQLALLASKTRLEVLHGGR